MPPRLARLSLPAALRACRRALLPALCLWAPLAASAASAQTPELAEVLKGLPLREIGPAVAGGRISDIKVHPLDPSTWYVAAGSGGIWKTTNAGVTWLPVFDDEASYSIGTLAIDPRQPDIVWAGTGENVSGRHVGWGSGIYRSRNGGVDWEQMGLEASEHIGRILIHPSDSRTLLVAAEGPLWSEGGERGVYVSRDGGESWRRTLDLGEDTGVTDIEFQPGNPDIVYAAAYQRRRHIWGFMAGGPASGIYKSTDGGESWRRIERGLPSGDMGKIGLAVTPADPLLVYATIEATSEQRGFYRSSDAGESWERRNNYISGGTGPHYYQEIEASPHDSRLVIQMDVFFRITRDGGATFSPLGDGRQKHSDNHALWIDPEDGRHMLAGSDAGLYETFDQGETWRHFPNMPISQFYKVAVSSSEPFYDVMAGAQDLGTLLGPSRTTTVEGVRNSDWYFPMGADGYGVDFHPDDPQILYLMTQQGNLYRVDRRDEEAIRIQPQPRPEDEPERWNWDSPLLISPHDADRLYFASQRLWRSDDRGNSWTPISVDLTTSANRYTLPFMGRVWELDALHDNGAMSKYATLTAISESPVREGLIYVGSDDGLIHRTRDGGDSWARLSPLPGVPERSFINDVEAGLHGEDVIFAAADAHKTGDYAPYLFRSEDGGESWISITGDLPAEMIVWAIKQDHLRPELLFVAGEWGLYVTVNGGAEWRRLEGAPTIAFRDLQLQRRDGDVVGATFGRGIYILDDYAPLRELAAEAGGREVAGVWPVRDAWLYIPSVPNQAPGRPTLGSDAYSAPNPPFGATFSYYVPETLASASETRKAREAELRDREEDVPFPGYDRLRDEEGETQPGIWLEIRDADGGVRRRIGGRASKGLHRTSWDLRGPPPNPVSLDQDGFRPPWAGDPIGPLDPPGRYSVAMIQTGPGGARQVGEARFFDVRAVPDERSSDLVAASRFQHETAKLQRGVLAAGRELDEAMDALRGMRSAFTETPEADHELLESIDELDRALIGLSRDLRGDRTRSSLDEPSSPSIQGRVGSVIGGHWRTRSAPTATQRQNILIARTGFDALRRALNQRLEEASALRAALLEAGAPWFPGTGSGSSQSSRSQRIRNFNQSESS